MWFWDIPTLMDSTKWTYFYLHPIIGICNRRLPAGVSPTVTAPLASTRYSRTPPSRLASSSCSPDRGPSIKAKVTALLLADPTTRITTISGIGLMTPDYGLADAAHAGRQFGDGRLKMRQTSPML